MKSNAFSRTRTLVCALCLGIASGWTGYCLHDWRADTVLSSAAGTIPGLEYLSPPQSFSRIENTRSTLEALCQRVRLQAERALSDSENSTPVRTGSASTRPRQFEDAVRDLESAMLEFRGTEEELYLAQDLLLALKRAGRFDRWLVIYLKALYEQPTHPVVARFSKEAGAIAKRIGRETDVLAGLRHLSSIPWDFDNKDRIEAALAQAEPMLELAHAGGLSPSDHP